MSRRFIVAAKRGLGGDSVSIDVNMAEELQKSLQRAYDILESMDDETFQAVDGEPMIEDLNTYIMEVASAKSTYLGMEDY